MNSARKKISKNRDFFFELCHLTFLTLTWTVTKTTLSTCRNNLKGNCCRI